MAILDDIYGNLGISGSTKSGVTNPYAGAQTLNVPGLGNFSPQDVVSYVNSNTPTQLAGVVNQYGIDPMALTAAYNTGAGTNVGVNQAMQYLGMPSVNNFDIPMNLFPTSTSSSGGSSHSGINWSSPATATALPYLQQATEGLTGYVNSIPELLQNYYGNLMNQALSPEAFQGTLNNLSSRGVLNSSVASNTMAELAKSIANNIGNQGYQSQLQGVQAQLSLPDILGKIATLGQETNQSSGSSSSSSNPLAPYQLAASLG